MKSYKKIIEEMAARRKNNLIHNEYRLINALRENDELHKLDVTVRTIEQDKRHGRDIDENLLNELKFKRQALLKSLGIMENPPPTCEKCGDTGTINGKPCACVIAAATTLESSDVDFSDCDLSVFDESDRVKAENAYNIMKAFCAKFPYTNVKNIILAGGTGTGKTFLASCVASSLKKSGFSVMFVTAFGFVNRVLGYHTADMGEKLDYLLPLMDCDLLVIDDLGTESRLKNVTVEYLYSVLNERMRLGKHTMITTNCDKDMLASRYGERVFSRLFDKRISTGIVLAEKDIRKIN